MEHASITKVKEKIGGGFTHLPSYASYLLHHALQGCVEELVRLYEETDIPLLRFFKLMDNHQRIALVTGSTREMLTMLAANDIEQYIGHTINNWLTNQLPQIRREQVHSQDITLANYVRGKVFRQFLHSYTNDAVLRQNLIEELDRFTVILNSELFESYIELQREEINKINGALKKREAQLLEAQDVGQIGSFEWDIAGEQSSYTPQMFKIFEMQGPSNLTSFLDNVHPDEKEKVRKAIEKAFVNGDYECEYRYLKNGKEKVILSRGKVQFEDGKPVRMIGTITDVTERHLIVRKLQESEKLHKQAQALTHIGNWSWLIGENRITWSDEMYRIYGLEPQSEEITFEKFLSFVHPEDKQKRTSEIQQALETLKVDEYYFKIRCADGKEKVLRGKGEVRGDEKGQPLVMLGTCQDITREFNLTEQLRERERYLEELNRSLEYANQELSRTNEELESFNFIASHDLQEPLRKIQVYSNRILENGFGALHDPLKDYFEKINNASRRMQNLIEDFLSFSQTFSTNQTTEAIDLNRLLEEIKAELVTRIEEKQAVITATKLPAIRAVYFQIKQLMTNLIGNALKYSQSDSPPEIMIRGSIVTGSDVPDHGANNDLEYTCISVLDNGIGFDPLYRSKIFELFQRLHSKNSYSGTGIGLALCKKIVRNMDGFITADSQPGKGSVFTFFIPVMEEPSSVPEIDPAK
jgi:PAS domain S-box-containing protein